MVCEDCGARFSDEGDSCAQRFELLLALDHSHQEPWGSRHGLAFAVFVLQHPGRYETATAARAYELLMRVFERGETLDYVIRDLRARGRGGADTDYHPPTRGAGPFPVTIADLGEFAASEYAVDLDRWCRSTVHHLRCGARSA